MFVPGGILSFSLYTMLLQVLWYTFPLVLSYLVAVITLYYVCVMHTKVYCGWSVFMQIDSCSTVKKIYSFCGICMFITLWSIATSASGISWKLNHYTLLKSILTFRVWLFKYQISSACRALFNLSTQCRTFFSCSDGKVVHLRGESRPVYTLKVDVIFL